MGGHNKGPRSQAWRGANDSFELHTRRRNVTVCVKRQKMSEGLSALGGQMCLLTRVSFQGDDGNRPCPKLHISNTTNMVPASTIVSPALHPAPKPRFAAVPESKLLATGSGGGRQMLPMPMPCATMQRCCKDRLRKRGCYLTYGPNHMRIARFENQGGQFPWRSRSRSG